MEAIFSKICHQDPLGSLIIAGNMLPLCARCTGIYVGFAISGISFFVISRQSNNNYVASTNLGYALFLISACILFLDVMKIYATKIATPNFIKYLFGLLFGASCGYILLPRVIRLIMNKSVSQAKFNLIMFAHIIMFLLFLLLPKIDSIVTYWLLYSASIIGFFLLCIIVSIFAIYGIVYLSRAILFFGFPGLKRKEELK